MKIMYTYALALGLSATPLTASAGLDSSKPFLCATNEVMECAPTEGCKNVSADSIDAPRFFRIDVKNKKISTASAGSKQKSTIERIEKIEGKLMLQGAEEGREGQRDGMGWTMTISEEGGDMVVTAAGGREAFVIFGACTAL